MEMQASTITKDDTQRYLAPYPGEQNLGCSLLSKRVRLTLEFFATKVMLVFFRCYRCYILRIYFRVHSFFFRVVASLNS